MIVCPLPCVNACQLELDELVNETYQTPERCPYWKYRVNKEDTPHSSPSQPRHATTDKPGIPEHGGAMMTLAETAGDHDGLIIKKLLDARQDRIVSAMLRLRKRRQRRAGVIMDKYIHLVVKVTTETSSTLTMGGKS